MKFGPVVAFEDNSEETLWGDELVIVDMVVHIEFLNAEDALNAIQTLDSVDHRPQREKNREPALRVENLFSCRMKDSPVQYSGDVINCAASWQIKWVMPANQIRAMAEPRRPGPSP